MGILMDNELLLLEAIQGKRVLRSLHLPADVNEPDRLLQYLWDAGLDSAWVMPATTRSRTASCSWLEQVVSFLPVPALPYLDTVADALAAPDLGRTHPLPVQTTRQPFAVKDGASQLDVGAPDAGAHAIVGASTRAILRRSFPQGSAYRRLQVPGEVNVLVHIPLALFHDREGAHPHHIARAP